jgi:hypothetical protein
MRDKRAVQVPEDVYEGLAYARRKGYGHYVAWGVPADFLIDEGYLAAGFWIMDNVREYQRGYVAGFACPGKRGLRGMRFNSRAR